MPYQKIVLFLLLVLNSACSTFRGIYQEEKTNSVLRPYASEITYPYPRREVAKFIVAQVQKNHRWHLKHDTFYRLGTFATAAPLFEIKGNPIDIQDVREAFDPEGAKIAVLYDEALVLKDKNGRNLFQEREPGPVEFHGVREIYILYATDKAHSTVQVVNSADRKRLFHKELELYESAIPEKARELKAKIRKEHPDIVFQPFS